MPTHCAQNQSHFFSIALLSQTVFYSEHGFYLGKNGLDSKEMAISNERKRTLLKYCARGACQCNCSSVALPIQLPQAWIRSLSTLAQWLSRWQARASGLRAAHAHAVCSTAAWLLLPVGEELSRWHKQLPYLGFTLCSVLKGLRPTSTSVID